MEKVQIHGEERAVGKWANDNDDDFDAIYQHILMICESAKKGEKIFEGKYDWAWNPEGFPSNKSIHALTKPKVK